MKRNVVLFSSLMLVIFGLTIVPSSSVLESQTADLTVPDQVVNVKIAVLFEDGYYYHDSYRSAFITALETVKANLAGTINITYNATDDINYMQYTNSRFDENLRKMEADFYLDYYDNESMDVVIAVGRELTVPIRDYAVNYTDMTFLLIDKMDTRTVTPNNTVSVTFDETEGAFLGGVAAATQLPSSVTKFGIITDFPPRWSYYWPLADQFITGFCAGVRYVREDQAIEFSIENIDKDPVEDYLTADQYQDRAKGIANEMFDNGVGAILAVSGNGDAGIYESAEAKSGLVIATNSYEDAESPSILTSIIKNFTAPLQEFFTRYNAEFKDSEKAGLLEYDVVNGGVVLSNMSLYGEDVTDTLVNVTEAIKAIKNGFVIPPYNTGIVPGLEWIVAVLAVLPVAETWRRKRRSR
ncbi:MAG: BMP family lipoprotein [Candidatus Hodarchaeales archaeon]|jgi:basic membrane lipoprotein Med (substrate-binding protein (PBP1-ABC) superfamily)